MNISSRTPEGDPNRCPLCGNDLRLEPSRPPGDAPCPSCGNLLWFPTSTVPSVASPSHCVDPNAKLIPDEGNGDSIALSRPVLTLGRRESCDICVRQPNVSGRHCELTFCDGHWLIKDLNSINGLKVNGIRVREKFLHTGDVITIGKRNYTIVFGPLALSG